MPGKLSLFGELSALTSLFRDQDIYMGLATSAITRDDSIADITEVAGEPGYSRQLVLFKVPEDHENRGSIFNAERVDFGPWQSEQTPPILYSFLTNAPSGPGEIIAYAQLPTPKAPDVDELMVLRVDDLLVQIYS